MRFIICFALLPEKFAYFRDSPNGADGDWDMVNFVKEATWFPTVAKARQTGKAFKLPPFVIAVAGGSDHTPGGTVSEDQWEGSASDGQ
jgi:hypothetical protein